MAIRYSGDVEVRLHYKDGVYIATVREPRWSGRCEVTEKQLGLTRKQAGFPDSYDKAAKLVLALVWRIAWKKSRVRLQLATRKGHILVQRTFQAPCPNLCD